MKLMRIFVLVAFSAVLLLPSSAHAHSGRTDSHGGHHDYNNVSGLGDYHYHHGHPAHLHTNGVCPYAFDDRTGQNSEEYSSERTVPIASSQSSKPDKPSLSNGTFPWGPCLALGGAVGIGGYLRVKTVRRRRREKQQYEARREQYLTLYGGKSVEELARMAGMPDGVEIGTDDLPKEVGTQGWGERFTYYVAPSGKAYHRVCECNRSAVHPINAVNIGGRSPCCRCRPNEPDLEWYGEYRRIRAIMREYNIQVIGPIFICGTPFLRSEEGKLMREREDIHEGKP